MGYILFLLLFSIGTTGLVWYLHKESCNQKSNTNFIATLSTIISIGLICSFVSTSYINTICLYGKAATIKEHKATVDLYVKAANGPKGAKGKLISDLTDQKYEDYQDNLYIFVNRLNSMTVSYNGTLANKKALKDRFFFSMLVSYPDDLVPIAISTL